MWKGKVYLIICVYETQRIMEILRTSGESALVFQAAEPLYLRVVKLREDEWLELYQESIPYNGDKA